MYIVPEDLKEKLKEPLGHLVDGKELFNYVKNAQYIVSVGDQVTYTLLTHEVTPALCIVDYILERKKYTNEMRAVIKGMTGIHIQVKNPPGTITDELWDAIETVYRHLENGPFCIEVEGEEDLASLAAIYLAPGGVTVIYGLPNKGVLVVKATKAHKRKVKEVLDQM